MRLHRTSQVSSSLVEKQKRVLIRSVSDRNNKEASLTSYRRAQIKVVSSSCMIATFLLHAGTPLSYITSQCLFLHTIEKCCDILAKLLYRIHYVGEISCLCQVDSINHVALSFHKKDDLMYGTKNSIHSLTYRYCQGEPAKATDMNLMSAAFNLVHSCVKCKLQRS